MSGRETMRIFSGQWYHVKQGQNFCTETLKKVFCNAKKMASRNIFRHFFRAIFFMFVLLIKNHTVFLVQLEINLNLRVFQKVHSCRLIPNWTRNRIFNKKSYVFSRSIWNKFALVSFSESSLVQINSKLNSKPYDYHTKALLWLKWYHWFLEKPIPFVSLNICSVRRREKIKVSAIPWSLTPYTQGSTFRNRTLQREMTKFCIFWRMWRLIFRTQEPPYNGYLSKAANLFSSPRTVDT